MPSSVSLPFVYMWYLAIGGEHMTTNFRIRPKANPITEI